MKKGEKMKRIIALSMMLALVGVQASWAAYTDLEIEQFEAPPGKINVSDDEYIIQNSTVGDIRIIKAANGLSQDEYYLIQPGKYIKVKRSDVNVHYAFLDTAFAFLVYMHGPEGAVVPVMRVVENSQDKNKKVHVIYQQNEYSPPYVESREDTTIPR